MYLQLNLSSLLGTNKSPASITASVSHTQVLTQPLPLAHLLFYLPILSTIPDILF